LHESRATTTLLHSTRAHRGLAKAEADKIHEV